MKRVSDAYRESMAGALRNRSYIKIVFGNVDPAAAAAAELSGEMESYGEFDTVPYVYNYGETYATLELNAWDLGGKKAIIPDMKVKNEGYVNKNLTDGNGVYGDQAAVVSCWFHDKKGQLEQHTFPGLTLVFDTRRNEWPTELEITFYDEKMGKEIVKVNPTGTRCTVSKHGVVCVGFEIAYKKHLPHRRARLEQILFGLEHTYTNKDIMSVKQSHDIDPLSRRLPKESFSFTIIDYEHNYDPDNPEGIYRYVDEKSPISFQFGYDLPDGTIEWLKPDKYIMNSKPSAANNKTTFKGTGLVGSMTDKFYKSKLGRKSFYDMAVEILMDAGLTLTSSGDHPWEIDPALKSMYTTAVLPIDTHMNCLQLIAHACRCKLYSDDDNVIHIAPFVIPETGATPDFTMDFNTIKWQSQSISKIDALKAVNVSKYSYTPSAETSTIFEETTTETTLHVEFSGLAQDIQIAVAGGTLESSVIYGRAADLVLSSGTKTVTITGKTLAENTVVVSYPVAVSGEIDEEKNPLLTDDSMCQALAEHVIAYLTLRNTYDLQYRGNPELETGDLVALQTQYTNNMKALVLTNELTFNGSLSGKVKVKGL